MFFVNDMFNLVSTFVYLLEEKIILHDFFV